jgi:perosamine synthetase
MQMYKIQHNRPTLGIREAWAAFRTIRTGWVAQGIQVEAFENELCNFLGLPIGHAVCVSSGTAALALALWSIGVKGKKIALPVYACSSLRHAVAFAGGIEHLVDVKLDSPNVDSEAVNKAKPFAVIVPHMFGIPAEIKKMDSDIRIVEDCAQAIGGIINGQQVGTIGDIGIYSFYVTKLMTAGGQGGAVVSRDKSLVDEVRDYREFDCRRDTKVRFNFQLSDTLASVGRVQLQKLPSFLKKREELFQMYEGGKLLLLGADAADSGMVPVRYRAVLRSQNPLLLQKKLFGAGIKTIIPIEEWELLGNSFNFRRAGALCTSTLSLPIYPSINKHAVRTIIRMCSAA